MSGSVSIIGSGMAATTLVRELRKLDAECDITLFTRDNGAVYSKPMLSNAWAQNRSLVKLQSQTAEQFAEAQQIRLQAFTTVDAIDRERQQIRVGQQHHDYEQLVLAVGANPIDIPLDGATDSLYQVNTLADYARFRPAAEAASSIAIIGPGLIGCEFANDLLTLNKSVHLIGPDPWPVSSLLPEAAGRYWQQQLEQNGLQFHLQSSVTQLQKHHDGVSLTLDSGKNIEVDVVLSAIGLRPDIALAKAAGLTTQRGIVIDEYCRAAESVYALGDCAEWNGQVLPYVLPLMTQARALAKSLSGTPTTLAYPPMPVVIKTPTCPISVLPSDATWHCEAIEDGLRCLAYADDKLQGFCLLGSAAKQRQQWLKAL